MITNKWRKKLKIMAFIVAIGGISFYGYFQAYDLIKGPIIDIQDPKEHEVIEDDIITLKGQAKNASKVEINGRSTLLDPNGVFIEKLPLIGARTIIKIEAWDRFNRKKVVYHSIRSNLKSNRVPSAEELRRIRSGEAEQEENEDALNESTDI
ncbi:MAG: hypothetical protein ACLFNN_02815 [Candidatus Paceibacterota bacterium]